MVDIHDDVLGFLAFSQSALSIGIRGGVLKVLWRVVVVVDLSRATLQLSKTQTVFRPAPTELPMYVLHSRTTMS
jgi:hypothetical protein